MAVKKFESSEKKGIALLLLTSLIWGSGFAAIKHSLTEIDPYWFMSLRFILASLASGIVFRKRFKYISNKTLKHGIIMGFLVSFSLLFQVLGCAHTTVGKNAFLTSVYVAVIPFISWVRKRKIPRFGCFVGAAVCMTGIAMLSLSSKSGINKGDVLSLISGLLWAFDFEYTGEYAKESEAEDLLLIQIITSAVITFIPAFLFSPFPSKLPSVSVIGCMIYTGIIANCVSYLLQFKGQKLVHTFTSGVIFALEAVFAGIFSFVFFKEEINFRFIIGGTMIFMSVLVPRLDFTKLFHFNKAHS